MQHSDLTIIELAVQHRLLTRRQADQVRQELEAGNALGAGDLMLEKHFVTKDQLAALVVKVESADEGIDQLDTHRSSRPPIAEEEIRPPTVAERAAAGTPRPASPPQPPPPQASAPKQPAQPTTLTGMLRLARHWGCSDLHLSVGRPPFVRLHGQIRYMEMEPLTPEKSQELNFSVLTPEQQATLQEQMQLDFALELPNVGRHRCNVFRQRLGWDGAYRIVRASVPTIQELGLPESVRVYTEYNQGLVMVTGPGGSGKTTTVAALLDLVNAQRRDHIITVEDPVEYLHSPKGCQVTQREVGLHTESFGKALRAALREDPDIILIGELRDLETTSISITAAETGHLVFSTLPTGTAVRTVARIVDVFPISQQTQICTMVAESLRGVISQQLVPRRDQKGRVLAVEVMMNTTGVAQQIKEGKTHMIQSLIQGGKKHGMIMMEESLLNLHRQGLISGREAYLRASNKQPFDSIKDDV